MLRTSKRCSVCQKIKTNKVLLNKIYDTTYYNKRAEQSLRQLAIEYQMPYQAMLNHAKKHQALDSDKLIDAQLQDVAKKAENSIIRKSLESKDIWDSVLEKGQESLAEGTMQIKAGDMLRAAKDKSDYDFKVKDQQLAMMEMVMFFASGEGETNLTRNYDRRIIETKAPEDTDSAQTVAGNLEGGEEQPYSVHYPPTWDAPALGSGQISNWDAQT